MGALDAGFGLPLADAIDAVQNFVQVFALVYALLIFAYILTSWFRMPYSLNRVQRFLYDVVEPYLRLFRRLLPPLGPLDLSPILAIFVLWAVVFLINSVLLDRLH